jgi:hypothetical protein
LLFHISVKWLTSKIKLSETLTKFELNLFPIAMAGFSAPRLKSAPEEWKRGISYLFLLFVCVVLRLSGTQIGLGPLPVLNPI